MTAAPRLRPLATLALTALLSGPVPLSAVGAPAAADPPAADAEFQTRMLRDAETWEALGRGDRAVQVLERLRRVQPDDARLLFELGQLHLRIGDTAAAESVLDDARRRQPQAAETAQLALAVRLATDERERWQAAQRLAEDDDAQAEAALAALFPDGAPDGDLGVRYWRLRAQRKGQLQPAQAGVAAIVQRWPAQSRYRWALVDLLTEARSTRQQGLRELDALLASEVPPSEEQRAIWRYALMRGGVDRRSERLAQRYFNVAGNDADLAAWRQRRGNVGGSPGAGDPLGWQRSVERALLAGKPQRALERLARQPDSAERRHWQAAAYAQLAEHHARAGALAPAIRAQQDALAAAPTDPWQRLALVRLLRTAGRADEADRVRAEGVARIDASVERKQRNVARAIRAEAEAQALLGAAARASGGTAEADRRRAHAAEMDPTAPWLALRQAEAEIASGNAEAARARLAETVRRNAQSGHEVIDARFAQALLLERLGEFDAASATLAAVPETLRSRDIEALARRVAARRRDAELARRIEAGDTAGARALLGEMTADPALDLDGAIAAAGGEARLGRPEAGLALLARHAPAPGTPRPAEWRLLDAELRHRVATTEAATPPRIDDPLRQTELPALLSDPDLSPAQRARAERLDIEVRLGEIASLHAAGRDAEAEARFDEAWARYPDDVVLLDARAEARMAARQWRPALADLHQVAERAEAPWRRERAELRIAGIEARRQDSVSLAPSFRERPGVSGQSKVAILEVPAELRLSLDYDATLFAKVDRVQADAGRVSGDFASAARYGQVLAQGAAAYAPFAAGTGTAIGGTALALGWENDRWRLDLGTTPIGFPVVDVVGGLRWQQRDAGQELSAELARRPITNSVLSYGGARDPVSGEVWGGARNQRLKLRLARHLERMTVGAQAEAGVVTGRRLPDNRQFQLQANADWRWIDRPALRLTVGLEARHWQFARNLNEYSFGHGGYFSPQQYSALLLPLDWQARFGALSLRLRGSVALLHTVLDRAPFHPGRADLQAAAEAQAALPGAGLTAFHAGSDDIGFGRSLSGVAEYALDRDWTLGAMFDIDRAAFFSPNTYGLYLRRSLRGEPPTLPLPPYPPQPYSAY